MLQSIVVRASDLPPSIRTQLCQGPSLDVKSLTPRKFDKYSQIQEGNGEGYPLLSQLMFWGKRWTKL